MKDHSSSFAFYEKGIVFLFISCLYMLACFSLLAPEERWPKKKVKRKFKKQQIVVHFTGEIEGEGRYHFLQGTTLREALLEVSLKPNTQIDKLDLDAPLKVGQRIRIKKVKKPFVKK